MPPVEYTHTGIPERKNKYPHMDIPTRTNEYTNEQERGFSNKINLKYLILCRHTMGYE